MNRKCTATIPKLVIRNMLNTIDIQILVLTIGSTAYNILFIAIKSRCNWYVAPEAHNNAKRMNSTQGAHCQ